MRLPGSLTLTLAFALVGMGPARAQIQVGEYGVDHYEMQYGDPVDVTVESLMYMPESYYDRAVRVSGKLDMGAGQPQTRGGQPVWMRSGQLATVTDCVLGQLSTRTGTAVEPST